MTTKDIFEKEHKEESRLQEEEKEIRKNLREEYCRIHKLNKKIELLRRIEPRADNPCNDLNNHFDSVKKVHFNYLKKFSAPTEESESL